jgi:hypothetical protein
MKKWQGGILGAVAAALLSAAPVQAAPSLGAAFDNYNGPVKIKFENWESFDTRDIEVGSINFGVLRVTSIHDADGNALFVSGFMGSPWLTGVFYGIEVTEVTPDGTGFNGKATGGRIDIYLNPTNFDPNQGTGGYGAAGCAIGGSCYNGITNVPGGELVLSLELASGIDPLNSNVTLNADFNTATLPTSGGAQAYYNVIGGSLASKFDTDSLDTPFGKRDMYAENNFCPNGFPGCGTEAGDWQLQSDDPIEGYVIPEPATLAVLGVGLLGLGVAVRRRRRA